MPSHQKPFLSAADVALRLGVSRNTAYNFISEGIVPVVRIRGVRRVPAAALEIWVADRAKEALDAVRSAGP
jgi:excisionase family DNA binding protein